MPPTRATGASLVDGRARGGYILSERAPCHAKLAEVGLGRPTSTTNLKPVSALELEELECLNEHSWLNQA